MGSPIIFGRRRFVELLTYRDDQQLISRTGRSLCRGIESTQRFDHVSDEFQPDRFCIACRKNVDNATTDGKGTVLLDGILAGEARVDEEVREVLRIDLRSGSNVDRCAQQALGPADARK